MFPWCLDSVPVVEATRNSERPPRAVIAVLVVLGVEVFLLLAVVGSFVRGVLTGRSSDAELDAVTVVLCVVLAAVLVACGRALLRGQRWARAPVVTLQLLTALALALPGLAGDAWWQGAGLLALCAVAVLGLLAPSAVQHTQGSSSPPVG